MDRAALRKIGTTIRHHRRQLGLSQEALAERAGITQTYVSEIEAGSRNASILLILSISRALGLTPAELLGEFTMPVLRRLRLR